MKAKRKWDFAKIRQTQFVRSLFNIVHSTIWLSIAFYRIPKFFISFSSGFLAVFFLWIIRACTHIHTKRFQFCEIYFQNVQITFGTKTIFFRSFWFLFFFFFVFGFLRFLFNSQFVCKWKMAWKESKNGAKKNITEAQNLHAKNCKEKRIDETTSDEVNEFWIATEAHLFLLDCDSFGQSRILQFHSAQH